MFFSASGGELSQLEKEYAEKNRGDLSSVSDFAQFSSVSLVPETFRDSGSERAGNQNVFAEVGSRERSLSNPARKRRGENFSAELRFYG
jgi:hypothetical protein